MKILMVCLGNICRSPLAHGILEREIQMQNLDWEVDSAGTSGWHEGELPDQRSIEVAKENGLDITNQRSRAFTKKDFKDFDLIVVMDSSNFSNVKSLADNEAEEAKIKLLLNYSYPGENRAVPDPYYHGGFPKVYSMIEDAVLNLIKHHV
ncbi:MAG: low molecular weight phosphotyrosine protein phosphatase [Saprospiraceae bacterium]|nr:low molecular weight phosphotyrosine protein phosphatase [Bacteroidia bacterium]NNE15833.1 low molecular weight phosphotyrosine protein phosphatase [Saprospiraceae bacterium]NNL91778.1 low molecular weight phosphotyrosine protein phosphatase [Saprospiraceae bacterium]